MTIKEPESMDELVYFTNRSKNGGSIMAWVYREDCPKCGKAKMGKPKNPKTGKPKIRAKEFVCEECENVIEKEEYEESLNIQVKYTCPKCKHKGETEVPFKWKGTSFFDEEKQKKVSVKAVVFNCDGCGEKILITKKMK